MTLPVRRVAGILLVDHRGWLLLQERDDRAPVAADTWGMCGGGVEVGESFAEAAVRELAEETGLTGIDLVQALRIDFPPSTSDIAETIESWAVFVGSAGRLTDDDVVLGEGRQIIFRDPGVLDDATLPMPTKIRDLIVAAMATAEFAEISARARASLD